MSDSKNKFQLWEAARSEEKDPFFLYGVSEIYLIYFTKKKFRLDFLR